MGDTKVIESTDTDTKISPLSDTDTVKRLIADTGLTIKVLGSIIPETSEASLKNYASGRRRMPPNVFEKIKALVDNRERLAAGIVPPSPTPPVSEHKKIAPPGYNCQGIPVGAPEKDGEFLQVVIPTAEDGYPEFDILEDGWARGFKDDSLEIRAFYRTSHALRRIAESKGDAEWHTPLAKWFIQIWDTSQHHPSVPKLKETGFTPEIRARLIKHRLKILKHILGLTVEDAKKAKIEPESGGVV